MTLDALIAEDEPIARRTLRELIATVPWLACVGEAENGLRAVELIDSLQPDLVFLDVEMPGVTGLEVLERVRYVPAVIFTTAYDRYAVGAFELGAVDYLVKPFGRQRFLAAAERARRTLKSPGERISTVERVRVALDSAAEPLSRIFVRDRGAITPVPVGAIERLEAEDDYVAVHADGQRYLVFLPLADFERRLDTGQFLRVHRCHIVNVEHVRRFVPFDGSRLQVEMRDGTRIIASRARSKELRHLAL